jgi:hypothetical protein
VHARELWRGTFALIPLDEWRPDEVELMRQLCQAITDLDAIETALRDAPLLFDSPRQGTVANPLLSERRMTRNLILSIQKALKLPTMADLDEDQDDEPDNLVRLPGQPMSRSESARIAANAKWAKRRAGNS